MTPPPANVFLDTSALLKRFVEERGTHILETLLTDPDFRGRIFVAAHVEPELVSALNGLYRQAGLSHRTVEKAVATYQRLQTVFAIVSLDTAVVNDAAFILNTHRTASIRAGDALHLAAMRYVGRTILESERLALVSADRSMLLVASRLGMETLNPEREGLGLLRR